MKAVILCAGYATRLYPLTLDKPKALLSVKGKPLLDYTIEKIGDIVDEIIIVSNSKFYQSFASWAKNREKVKVIDDETSSNETRLGGVGDLHLAIEKEKINEDVLVILGDNLFDFDIQSYIKEFNRNKRTLVGVYEVGKKEIVKLGQVKTLNGKIVEFAEKANPPISNLSSIGIYIFTKNDLSKIKEYMKTDKNKDGPGHLVKHLASEQDVNAYTFKGKWFDIGSKEVYNEVNKTWQS